MAIFIRDCTTACKLQLHAVPSAVEIKKLFSNKVTTLCSCYPIVLLNASEDTNSLFLSMTWF